jgi:hypothetical protein
LSVDELLEEGGEERAKGIEEAGEVLGLSRCSRKAEES